MNPATQQKRKVLVVGLGKTGLSCARYLVAHGVDIAITDTRNNPPGLEQLRAELPGVALFLGGFDERAFEHADEVVISPGVALREPAVARAHARGVPVIGDIELFAKAAKAPVVAVTGSNGKSTVTSLVGEMARVDNRDVRAGGNLGAPALSLLSETEPDLYVLELSSFQLETTFSLDAASATVLNVCADHMDRYPSLDAYIQAKRRIFRGTGVMVLNHDDARVCALAEPDRRVVYFGLGAPPSPADFGLRNRNGECWLSHGDRLLIREDELLLQGRHNVANALAALALGHAVGLTMEAMIEALRRFRGLAHRTQWVARTGGVDWFNDSKATNVGATLAAVSGMRGPMVLIAGGEGKDQDFSPLRQVLQRNARAVVLMGRDAPLLEQALAGAVPTQLVADMDEAVKCAAELARPGDTVVLSPACASFDMFENYEHRGECFMDAVRRLPT